MAGIVVNWKEVRSSWRRSGGEFWLLLKLQGDLRPTPDELMMAGDAANASTNVGRSDGEAEVLGGHSIALPVGVVVYMARTRDEASLRRWTDVYAEFLAGRGYEGELGRAPQRNLPGWLDDPFKPRAMTMYVAYTTDGGPQADERGSQRWAVPETSTARIARVASTWAYSAPGTRFMQFDEFCMAIGDGADGAAAAGDLLSSLIPRHPSGVSTMQKARHDLATSQFRQAGLAVYCYQSSAETWAQRLEKILQPAMETPELIDLAFVRPSLHFPVSWNGVDYNPPKADLALGWEQLYRNRFTWATPDVHAVQILTSAHLNRSHDLSGWDVSEIAPDRFLVQSRDLADWFEVDGPDSKVLDAARRDFGSMCRFE